MCGSRLLIGLLVAAITSSAWADVQIIRRDSPETASDFGQSPAVRVIRADTPRNDEYQSHTVLKRRHSTTHFVGHHRRGVTVISSRRYLSVVGEPSLHSGARDFHGARGRRITHFQTDRIHSSHSRGHVRSHGFGTRHGSRGVLRVHGSGHGVRISVNY